MTESDVKNAIMLELSSKGCMVFNRPTGLFYAKRETGLTQATYTPVQINIKGASDLQGHRPDGKAFYIEVKTPSEKKFLYRRILFNKTRPHDDDQINYIVRMRNSGAIAGFASSAEEALAIVWPEP